MNRKTNISIGCIISNYSNYSFTLSLHPLRGLYYCRRILCFLSACLLVCHKLFADTFMHGFGRNVVGVWEAQWVSASHQCNGCAANLRMVLGFPGALNK